MSSSKRFHKNMDEGKVAHVYAIAKSQVNYYCSNLSSRSYELSYQILTIEGQPWGDQYSRLLMLYPQFILLWNDSNLCNLELQ